MSWIDTMRTLDHPPFMIWLLIIKEAFFVLLIFRVFSGNWMGKENRRKKK